MTSTITTSDSDRDSLSGSSKDLLEEKRKVERKNRGIWTEEGREEFARIFEEGEGRENKEARKRLGKIETKRLEVTLERIRREEIRRKKKRGNGGMKNIERGRRG